MTLKVLLSGASGFVGTNLAERLGSWTTLVGVDVRKPVELVQGTTFIKGDLLDRKFLEVLFKDFGPFDVILHVAAQARVDPSLTDPIGTYRTNVEATINLLEAMSKDMRALPAPPDPSIPVPRRFIYASSEAIYGNADHYPTRENDHFRPINPYASSKIAGDVLVQQMNGRGLSTVVLRSGMGFGERSPPNQVMTKMILRLMDGQPLRFPKEPRFGKLKHPTRDCNYIVNFVDGITKLLDHPEVSGVYNLASGKETSLPDIAKMVVKVVMGLHTDTKKWIVQDEKFVYRPGELGMRTWLDISKARRDFGYNPTFSLESGLMNTYAWLKGGGRELYGW